MFCLWFRPVNSAHCQALSRRGWYAFGGVYRCADRRKLWRLYRDTTAGNRKLAATVQFTGYFKMTVFLLMDWFSNRFRYGKLPVKKIPLFFSTRIFFTVSSGARKKWVLCHHVLSPWITYRGEGLHVWRMVANGSPTRGPPNHFIMLSHWPILFLLQNVAWLIVEERHYFKRLSSQA
jgi:hypothetical protein